MILQVPLQWTNEVLPVIGQGFDVGVDPLPCCLGKGPEDLIHAVERLGVYKVPRMKLEFLQGLVNVKFSIAKSIGSV